MKILVSLALALFPSFLFAQSTVSGIVLDSLTHELLPSATVYVNGTTKGTVTNSDGRFILENVSFPATIVFSFVGYRPQALDLDRNPGALAIELAANSELPEVMVSGKDKKINKEDLEYFRKMFLGDDKWGKHATIKNENVLMTDNSFKTSYVVRKISTTSYSIPTVYSGKMVRTESTLDTVEVVTRVFSAWAYEPLIIDLPLLGYELYVDLVKFTVEKVNDIAQCDMLGYFYYKPYENLKKRRAESVDNNRMRAYYGSSQHFLRSFARNRLAENGYILTMPKTIVKGRKKISSHMPVISDDYLDTLGDNLIDIHDLKDKTLRIRYYHRSDGSPLNFRERGKGIHRYSESGMTVLEDECTFSKDGIIDHNNIRFTGDISKKRVAAGLPDDYMPITDTVTTNSGDVPDYAGQLKRFVDNIEQFNNLFPQEKVYLEFDNTAYFQGENIWFKAFVTNATTLERAPSGVLYVDFLAPTGQLILQQKLKIVAGQADGAIALIDAGTQQSREKKGVTVYPSGFYEIRAYTQNMLDFSPEAIFSRVIPVYTQPRFVGDYNRSHVENNQDNPLVEKLRGQSKEQKGQDKDVNVTFYPEGGSLVKGLPCRVAFKATGSDAFGLEGKLVIPGGWDTVRTVHDGMGSIIITPVDYMAANFYPSGSDDKYVLNLPYAESSGYSMISDMLSDSHLEVNVWRTPDRIGEQTALAVTCRGSVIYFEEIKDVENSQLNIDCSDWPVGVCRITLFNSEGRILSSRSIFHNNPEYNSPMITARTDSMSRQSCDKEVVEFKLTDESGHPLRDRFCLSVRDATDYGNGLNENLITNLLLSSDLRGYIHDPAWYLESDDELHREALNLLTLVQGWERYEWQTMTGLEEFQEKHRIEEGLTMNGWILSYFKRQPVSDISIYAALTPDDDKTMFESYDYQTDSTGYFGFDLSDFYGRGNFTIHLMSRKQTGNYKHEKSKRIRFERADRPNPRPYLKQETDLSHNTPQIEYYEFDFSDAGLTEEQRKNLGTIIGEVDIEEKGEKIRFIDYDTFTTFEVEEDAELELDQGEYTTDLRGYFLERGIRFAKEEDDYEFVFDEMDFDGYSVSGFNSTNDFRGNGNGNGNEGWNDGQNKGGNSKSNSTLGNIKPYFYVHNNEKYLGPAALSLDMADVKSIIFYDTPKRVYDFMDLIPLEVEFHNKRIHTMWFWWVLIDWDRYYLVDVQIKNDRELLFNWEKWNLGSRKTTVKGFTKPVQFYSPEYPDGPIEGNIDSRRTLYWNPNVITDEEGRARVEFYNNSFTRKFTINAAGITADGVPYVLKQNW